MSAEYVRRYYGVPAKRGMLVEVDGRKGWITSFSHRIHVSFWDSQNKRPQPCHPTWRVTYFLDDGMTVEYGD